MGFDLDADRLIERMGPETAAVVRTTPSNPTERVFDPGAIRAVVEAAGDCGAYVIADEVYARPTDDRDPRGVAARRGSTMTPGRTERPARVDSRGNTSALR